MIFLCTGPLWIHPWDHIQPHYHWNISTENLKNHSLSDQLSHEHLSAAPVCQRLHHHWVFQVLGGASNQMHGGLLLLRFYVAFHRSLFKSLQMAEDNCHHYPRVDHGAWSSESEINPRFCIIQHACERVRRHAARCHEKQQQQHRLQREKQWRSHFPVDRMGQLAMHQGYCFIHSSCRYDIESVEKPWWQWMPTPNLTQITCQSACCKCKLWCQSACCKCKLWCQSACCVVAHTLMNNMRKQQHERDLPGLEVWVEKCRRILKCTADHHEARPNTP